MRHRMKGRKLGRNASHRRAMFRNMAASLIRSVRPDEKAPNAPRVPGRIVTTVAKAKELRPFVEKLVTLACRAARHERDAAEFATTAARDTPEWRSWRDSDEWQKWNQAIAPAVAMRRRAFAVLRDNEAVDVLFNELASEFENRSGGYTRIVRLPQRRLGDAGEQALIEFVIEPSRDRVRTRRRAPLVTAPEASPAPPAEPESAGPEADVTPPAEPQAEAAPEPPLEEEPGETKGQ